MFCVVFMQFYRACKSLKSNASFMAKDVNYSQFIKLCVIHCSIFQQIDITKNTLTHVKIPYDFLSGIWPPKKPSTLIKKKSHKRHEKSLIDLQKTNNKKSKKNLLISRAPNELHYSVDRIMSL